MACPSYVRHRPEQTSLHALVREHLPAFLRHTSEHYARVLPAYVRRAFERYLRCGLPEHGFLRVRCDDCGHERVVAFSCKQRGSCPSCAGRIMANTGAQLVDRVLPRVPLRQWVLTLPFELRARAAKEPALVAAIDRILFREVERWMRRAAGPHAGCAGSVTIVQRFGGSLNLHVHFHALFLEGLFSRAEQQAPQFHPAPPPTHGDLMSVLGRVRAAALRWVTRRPWRGDEEPAALDACSMAAVQPGLFDRIEGADGSLDEVPQGSGRGSARLEGFDLHASVHVGADDDVARERLVRYCARPAFAIERLSVLPDGRIAYRIKQARRGATHRILTPLELLARIAALVPPPHIPFLRYHGVLAPSSKLRAHVVPRRDDALESCQGCPGKEVSKGVDEPSAAAVRLPASARPAPAGASKAALTAEPRASFARTTHAHVARLAGGELLAQTHRIEWSKLLQRSFELEVLVCPRCTGRCRIVAAVEDPAEARRYLRAVGEQSSPKPSGARDSEDDEDVQLPPPDD